MTDDDARPDGDAATVDALRGARPAGDRARMEAVRAKARAALFAVVEPARLGRFVLLETLGAGGMGVVHAAYDPQLDRKVALKLLRTGGADAEPARERLLGEARALARLKHPNVVAVHDVLAIDDQVVVVMEFVDGKTLADWAEAAPRSWRAVVDVYLQAGRGLAAAHGLGIVHRDFKPANAVVGEDGRVRVLDFGLARYGAAAEAGTPGAAITSAPTLTMTGALVGTPAYMAPEQLAGGAATVGSDQWSFCASLYEALLGVRPLAGDSAEALLAAAQRGELARPTDKRAVPAWLRALIERGLATDPHRRFPSMARLLDALGRERGWRRWRWPAVAAAAIAVAIAVIAVRPGRAGAKPEPCDGGAPELAAVWGSAVGDRLSQRFAALATPYAAEVSERVRAGLDGRAATWTSIHGGACEAHRRGGVTATTYDRQLSCLRRRLGDLRSAVAVLDQTDAASLASAVDVVARMAPFEWCADHDLLAREQEPPTTPEARAAVDAVRARLSQAEALERGARTSEALAEVDAALATARTLDYPPVVVEAALIKGRIAINVFDADAATQPLAEAEALAYQHGMLAQAVEAGARRIAFDALEERDLAGLERQAEVLKPMSEGLIGDQFARPLLLNNLVMLELARGRVADAQVAARTARAVLATIPSPALELTAILVNAGMLSDDPAEQRMLFTSAYERFADALGPHHRTTLTARTIQARHTVNLRAARALFASVCAANRQFTPTLVAERVRCLDELSLVDEELAATTAAVSSYAEIVALGDAAPEVVNPRVEFARGKIAASDGDLPAAMRHYRSARAQVSGTAWWDRALIAQFDTELAVALGSAGRTAEANQLLEHLSAEYAWIVTQTRVVQYQRGLARVQRLRAFN